MSQALAATSTTDIPWCIMGGSLCGSTFCPNILWCWLDPSVHTINVLWQPCQHILEHILKACHRCQSVDPEEVFFRKKFSSALFLSQCCRMLALVQIHESGPDSFQEQTSMSCTRHDTLYTCQNQARPMEHDGGRLLWSNMCEGRLEATTITTYYPKVVPLWILLEIWSLAYEAGWISATLKLYHCEFFWKSGVLVMQLDRFLPPWSCATVNSFGYPESGLCSRMDFYHPKVVSHCEFMEIHVTHILPTIVTPSTPFWCTMASACILCIQAFLIVLCLSL